MEKVNFFRARSMILLGVSFLITFPISGQMSNPGFDLSNTQQGTSGWSGSLDKLENVFAERFNETGFASRGYLSNRTSYTLLTVPFTYYNSDLPVKIKMFPDHGKYELGLATEYTTGNYDSDQAEKPAIDCHPVLSQNDLGIVVSNIDTSEKGRLTISDINGKNLVTEELTFRPNDVVHLGLTDLKPGMYFLAVHTAGVTFNGKFLK